MRRHPDDGARPETPLGQSSTIALTRYGDRTLAYAADADRHAVHTVDLEARALLATTPLPGAPSQLLVLRDGRVAVALRDRNQVVMLEPPANPVASLESLCAAEVATEPVALAATPEEAMLLVTSGWGHSLGALDMASLRPRFTVSLPREPRAVLVEPSGERAFVSHAVGDELSVVDLVDAAHPVRGIDVRMGDPKVTTRRAGQGFALAAMTTATHATRLFAPVVSADVAAGSVSTKVYGSQFLAVAPFVAVVDPGREALLTHEMADFENLSDLGGPSRACTLPRAAALLNGERLLMSCLGIDAVLMLDARARDPMHFELRRYQVPPGPLGIAAEGQRERAVVWSQFAAKVSVLDLREGNEGAGVVEVPIAEGPPPGMTASEARGRLLFHATNDPRISADARACASCHIDGREDGLTWTTPEGPHQTIMLAGRVRDSAPFGWRGETLTLRHHVSRTWTRLGGRGPLSDGDHADLDALIAYLKVMPAPEKAAPDEARRALVARGREIFDDPRQGCATCHPGGAQDGKAWDVARSPYKIPFDTPSLRFVGGTAPYFHDGRYATLDELLRKVDGAMGHTRGLSGEDLRALEAYLEEL